MKIAVVGSRSITDYESIEIAVKGLLEGMGPFTLVTGGARGVDRLAAHAARKLGIPVEEYKPDYAAHGRRAPLVRNERIVKEANYMLAFWDGESNGTRHVVALARAKGIECEVMVRNRAVTRGVADDTGC